MGYHYGIGLGKLGDGLNIAVLAILQGEDVLHGLGDSCQPLLRGAPEEFGGIKAVEHGLDDLMLLQHDHDHFFFGYSCLSSVALGVFG